MVSDEKHSLQVLNAIKFLGFFLWILENIMKIIRWSKNPWGHNELVGLNVGTNPSHLCLSPRSKASWTCLQSASLLAFRMPRWNDLIYVGQRDRTSAIANVVVNAFSNVNQVLCTSDCLACSGLGVSIMFWLAEELTIVFHRWAASFWRMTPQLNLIQFFFDESTWGSCN